MIIAVLWFLHCRNRSYYLVIVSEYMSCSNYRGETNYIMHVMRIYVKDTIVILHQIAPSPADTN